jgi:hypothetical protein
MTRASYIHVQSMRLASGHEALVARVLTDAGGVGYGFSFGLDAAQARHMAMWNAGLATERPHIAPTLDHPWEKAFLMKEAIPWEAEPAFARLQWLPTA